METKELRKTIWLTGKRLCNNDVSPSRSMHVILGLIFLKFVTDTNDEKSDEVLVKADIRTPEGADYEELLTYNEFFVPKKARWNFLMNSASDHEIGILIDEVIDAIEKLNKDISGLLPKNYSDPALDKTVLGEVVMLVGNIGLNATVPQKKELLADTYEYLLKKFAEKDKIDDNFYRTTTVRKLLVEMTEPRKGVVYDAFCGTGGLFIEIKKHLKKYRSKTDRLLLYGWCDNDEIIKIAKTNLLFNDIDAGLHNGSALTNDTLPDVKADYVLSWLPAVNANFAALQHLISKLTPTGVAGIVLPVRVLNGSSTEERKIRQALIEARLVDCIVTLPSQVFSNSHSPSSLWILTKNKTNNKYTDAGNEILFIDARRLKVTGEGRARELTDENILFISRTFQRWRNINGDYSDIKGFCRSVTIKEIIDHNFNLLPSEYISSRKVQKALPALAAAIMVSFLYFLSFKNSSLPTNSAVSDTALNATPERPEKDQLEEKLARIDNTQVSETTETEKEKDKASRAAVKTKAVLNSPATAKSTTEINSRKATPKTSASQLPDNTNKDIANSSGSYKVVSKAYFYNEPDERTRRKAFINHWNNSYAKIVAEDEKDGFIYVEFRNHLNQRSKGWLRKSDLKDNQ